MPIKSILDEIEEESGWEPMQPTDELGEESGWEPLPTEDDIKFQEGINNIDTPWPDDTTAPSAFKDQMVDSSREQAKGWLRESYDDFTQRGVNVFDPRTEKPKFVPQIVQDILEAPVGVGEFILHLGSMAPGMVLTGWGHIADVATGHKYDIANKIAERIIYEPKTKAGDIIRDVMFSPFTLLSKGGEIAGDTLQDILIDQTERNAPWLRDHWAITTIPASIKSTAEGVGVWATGKAHVAGGRAIKSVGGKMIKPKPVPEQPIIHREAPTRTVPSGEPKVKVTRTEEGLAEVKLENTKLPKEEVAIAEQQLADGINTGEPVAVLDRGLKDIVERSKEAEPKNIMEKHRERMAREKAESALTPEDVAELKEPEVKKDIAKKQKETKEAVLERGEERVKKLGEVMTPPALVKEMVERMPGRKGMTEPGKNVTDMCCGHGNFATEGYRRKISRGVDRITAIEDVMGFDISRLNVKETRQRLLYETFKDGPMSLEEFRNIVISIHNNVRQVDMVKAAYTKAKLTPEAEAKIKAGGGKTDVFSTEVLTTESVRHKYDTSKIKEVDIDFDFDILGDNRVGPKEWYKHVDKMEEGYRAERLSERIARENETLKKIKEGNPDISPGDWEKLRLERHESAKLHHLRKKEGGVDIPVPGKKPKKTKPKPTKGRKKPTKEQLKRADKSYKTRKKRYEENWRKKLAKYFEENKEQLQEVYGDVEPFDISRIERKHGTGSDRVPAEFQQRLHKMDALEETLEILEGRHNALYNQREKLKEQGLTEAQANKQLNYDNKSKKFYEEQDRIRKRVSEMEDQFLLDRRRFENEFVPEVEKIAAEEAAQPALGTKDAMEPVIEKYLGAEKVKRFRELREKEYAADRRSREFKEGSKERDAAMREVSAASGEQRYIWEEAKALDIAAREKAEALKKPIEEIQEKARQEAEGYESTRLEKIASDLDTKLADLNMESALYDGLLSGNFRRFPHDVELTAKRIVDGKVKEKFTGTKDELKQLMLDTKVQEPVVTKTKAGNITIKEGKGKTTLREMVDEVSQIPREVIDSYEFRDFYSGAPLPDSPLKSKRYRKYKGPEEYWQQAGKARYVQEVINRLEYEWGQDITLKGMTKKQMEKKNKELEKEIAELEKKYDAAEEAYDVQVAKESKEINIEKGEALAEQVVQKKTEDTISRDMENLIAEYDALQAEKAAAARQLVSRRDKRRVRRQAEAREQMIKQELAKKNEQYKKYEADKAGKYLADNIKSAKQTEWQIDPVTGERFRQRPISKTKDLYGPKVYEKEYMDMTKINELGPRKITLGGWLENPVRTFEMLGDKIMDLFFWPVKKAEKFIAIEKRETNKFLKEQIKKLPFGTRRKSSERIYDYAVAQQPEGLAVLEGYGVKEVPKLNRTEMEIYRAMRDKYEDFYIRLNEARKEAGMEPFQKVDNYFTFFHKLSELENAGYNPITTASHKINILTRMDGIIHPRGTPFRFAKERLKGGLKEAVHERDAFKVFGNYSNSAINHIHLTPAIAKGRELMHAYKPEGKRVFRIADEAPRAARFLTEWMDFQVGQGHWAKLPTGFEKALIKLNKNLAFAVLSWNLRSSLIQVSALRGVYTEVGPQYTLRGIESLFSKRKREFAMKNSNVLSQRQHDASLVDAQNTVRTGIVGPVKQKFGEMGLKPLSFIDMEVALAGWNSFYMYARRKGKMGHKAAVKYADRWVLKTQASAARSDLAPAQRIAIGKTATAFQTFVIGEWGWITKDLLRIDAPKKIGPKRAFHRVGRMVVATTLINMFYEDLLGVMSPYPTPLRELEDAWEKYTEGDYEDNWERADAFLTVLERVGGEFAEPMPIVGGAYRFGKGVVPSLDNINNLLADKGLSRKRFEYLMRFLGVPGTNQIAKMYNAYRRGEDITGMLLGRYSRPEDLTREERAERTRRRRDREQDMPDWMR